MLARLFAAQRTRIVDAWVEEVDHSSAPGSDPAARIIRDAATALYEAVCGQACDPADPDDPHLRIVPAFAAWQAARDKGPVQAAACVYLFKPLLRRHILPQAVTADCLQEYLEAESRLDSLALLVFAEYARSRERLQTARLDALRREQAAIRRWASRHGLDISGEAP